MSKKPRNDSDPSPAPDAAGPSGGDVGAEGADAFWQDTDSGDELLGGRIGPYRLSRVLAHGGMGSVFLAHREGDFHQEVAIKLVLSGGFDKHSQQRLQFEGQALARLEHPNIARLYDGGTSDDGLPYLVMERVRGLPIDQYCDQHRLSVRRRLLLLLPVLEAVAFAHSHLLVHCDIKPSNILVTDDGTPKLLDFGIAKLLGQTDPAKTALTVTGLRPMTLSHASPEQVMGGPISVASDIYALGILINTLLCGRLPYSVPMGHQLVLARAVVEQEPECPSRQVANGHPNPADPLATGHAESCGTHPKELARQLEGDLDAIVMKAIRKEPKQRYRSVQDLSADIHSYLDARPVSARGGNWQYRGSRLLRRMFWPTDPQRRRERWAWYGIFILLVAASGAALYLLQPPDPCLGAEQRLAGVWDDGTRADVKQSFLASGLPFAADSWNRVKTEIDVRAADWVATRTHVCRETHTRGEQSPRLLDLAQLCLDGRLEELRALIQFFREADEGVVISSIEAVGMLRDLEECRDPTGLAPRATPPTDPATRQALARARAVVETQDLRLRVRMPVDFEALHEVEAELRELGDSALRARALHVLGAAASDSKASPEESTARLEEALRAAIAGGDQPQQIRTYSALIRSLARNQGDIERARFWLDLAQATLESLGPGHFALRHEIAAAAGLMEWQAGNETAAKAYHLQALNYAERSGDSIRRIRTLGNLGIFGNGEEYAEVSKLIEEQFGSDHVMLAQPLANYATRLAYQGRYREALQQVRRSRDLLLQTHGDLYPQLTFPLTLIGQLLVATDRPEEAVGALERAERHYLATGRDPNSALVASIRTSLGEASVMTGDLETAEIHCHRAQEILAAKLPPDSENRIELARIRGDLSRKTGRIHDALTLHHNVIDWFEKAEYLEGHAPMLAFLSYGRTLQAAGRLEEATTALETALAAGMGSEGAAALASIRLHLAQLLWTVDRPRAQSLLADARAALSDDLPYHRRIKAEIDAWSELLSSP